MYGGGEQVGAETNSQCVGGCQTNFPMEGVQQSVHWTLSMYGSNSQWRLERMDWSVRDSLQTAGSNDADRPLFIIFNLVPLDIVTEGKTSI